MITKSRFLAFWNVTFLADENNPFFINTVFQRGEGERLLKRRGTLFEVIGEVFYLNLNHKNYSIVEQKICRNGYSITSSNRKRW